MICRDLASAERALFGERTGGLQVIRRPPSGGDRLDDLAQAFLDGDVARVQAAVEAHVRNVRSRPVIVKAKPKKLKILELRRRGCSVREIAEELCAHPVYVARVCRGLRLDRGFRRVDPEAVRLLKLSGHSAVAISRLLKISRRSVFRAMR